MHLCKLSYRCLLHGGLLLFACVLFSDVACEQVNQPVVKKEFDSLTPHHLHEVLLYSSKREFKIESPMPVQVFSGKQLEKLNSLSVAGAIRYY